MPAWRLKGFPMIPQGWKIRKCLDRLCGLWGDSCKACWDFSLAVFLAANRPVAWWVCGCGGKITMWAVFSREHKQWGRSGEDTHQQDGAEEPCASPERTTIPERSRLGKRGRGPERY